MDKDIIDLFAFNHKLKFNEIEKLIKRRSNKLAYHLKKLLNKGVLIKENDYYSLSPSSEYLIPFLSDKKQTLPVILIHIGDKDNAFLFKRNKRPYKDKLSLPGGRLVLGESIEQAAKRIMKEKFNKNIKLKKINKIYLEHLIKNNNIISSFLLFHVIAEPNEEVKLTNINKNKLNIIESDYKIMKNLSNSKLTLEEIRSEI